MKRKLQSRRYAWISGILLTVWWFHSTSLQAQSQCPTTSADLYRIEQFYRVGQFEMIAKEGPCLRLLFDVTAGSKNNELLSATEGFMHFYALSCLQLGWDSLAEEAIKLLLTRFPTHSLRVENDPPAFATLLREIVPYPKNRFGLHSGLKYTVARLSNPINIYTDLAISKPRREVNGRLQPEFGLEWIHNFSFRGGYSTGLTYEALGFSREYKSNNKIGTDSTWTVDFRQSAHYIQVPLQLQLRFGYRRNPERHQTSNFFVEAGVFGRALIASSSTVVGKNYLGLYPVDEIIANNKVDGKPPRREMYAMGGMAAFGYNFDLGGFSLSATVSGQIRFAGRVSNDSRYLDSYESIVWQYKVSDQYARLHSIQLTMGAFLPGNYKVHVLEGNPEKRSKVKDSQSESQ
jgi:hypothetical protein